VECCCTPYFSEIRSENNFWSKYSRQLYSKDVIAFPFFRSIKVRYVFAWIIKERIASIGGLFMAEIIIIQILVLVGLSYLVFYLLFIELRKNRKFQKFNKLRRENIRAEKELDKNEVVKRGCTN
jgi:hypothetical protein